MMHFVDPGTGPSPRDGGSSPRVAQAPEELARLHELCRDGRTYDVEEWIRSEKPLQVEDPEGIDHRRRYRSALEIALEQQNQALILLLLCNGYDPNRERHCPLDEALRTRRYDLVDLLLDWHTDPHQVDLEDLFGTYDSKLFERFLDLGVDLTADHAMAEVLIEHTSNKPLFGFARRHRKSNGRIQQELNIALGRHANRGNEKGVMLSLWAGADPHAPAPDLRHGPFDDEEDDADAEGSRFLGFTAIENACSRGHADILEKLQPDPSVDDFQGLYQSARSTGVIDLLRQHAWPDDTGAVVHAHVMRLGWNLGGWYRDRSSLYVLRHLFESGMRWSESSKETIAAVRSTLLKFPDDTFIDLIKLLTTKDYCSPRILEELARTPAIQRRMKGVGFMGKFPGESSNRATPRPTRSREVRKKLGLAEAKQSKEERPKLPRVVQIGQRRRGGREIRMDRRGFFEKIWSQPVSSLADEWGISDTGLAKACRRLQVPTPPRGYWAKLKAGKRPRRPSLPKLPEGEAEEIVLWAPDSTHTADQAGE